MPVSQTEISVREMRVQARMTLLLLLLLVFLLLFHLTLFLVLSASHPSSCWILRSDGSSLAFYSRFRDFCVSWTAFYRESRLPIFATRRRAWFRWFLSPFLWVGFLFQKFSVIFSRKIILDRDINSVSKVEFTKSWLQWKTIMKFYYEKLENWKFSLWLEN